MANVEGYVTVYESTDGGTGDPANTFWQFFVASSAVSTKNHMMAETMRLAINTNSRVRVTYDENTAGNPMLQARMEFKYICESNDIKKCDPDAPGPEFICETRRYAPCEPGDIPPDNRVAFPGRQTVS